MQWLWRLVGRVPCLRREVILALTDDTSLRGVLVDVVGAWFVLKRASVLTPSGPAVPMDGDGIVDRARLSFIQVVG